MSEKQSEPVIWTFYGRVLPDLPALSIPLPSHRSQSGLGFSFDLEGQIHNSKLMVVARVVDSVDIYTLRNAVAGDVQSSVDLAGFLSGGGFDVDLISVRSDNGSWQYFDAFIPALQVTGTIEVSIDLIAAVGADIQAQIMLADFREAIRVPVQTGFFCYRAIEAAMQSFKNGQLNSDKQAWPLFRQELRIDRKVIDRIKVHADWARHGSVGSVSDQDRLMLFQATRTVIRRYLDYIIAGRISLPAEKYEVMV